MTSDLPVIGFVLWRDAKADPPGAGRVVLTDEGMARCWPSGRAWEFEMPDMEGPCKPTVWCDPRPPVESEHGPLTMDDLRTAIEVLEGQWAKSFCAAAARLRRAIEEVGRG